MHHNRWANQMHIHTNRHEPRPYKKEIPVFLRIITRAFAVIGFLVTALVILVSSAVVVKMNKTAKVSPPDAVILSLDFDHPIVERNEPSPLAQFGLSFREQGTSLLSILEALDAAKNDPRVKAIVARFGTTQPSLAHAQEIRAALADFKNSNKPTYAWGQSYGSFGLGNRAYFLASAFDNIWLQPIGSVGLTGLAIQSPFAKTALEKIGVKADFLQREEYKSFMEMGMRDDYSPAARENMESLLGNLSDQIAAGIAESRKWDKEHVTSLMARGPYTAKEAEKEKLITKLGYADELEKEIKQTAGDKTPIVGIDTYLSYDHDSQPDQSKATHIALIEGTGLIVDKSSGAGGLAREEVMGAREIVAAFNAAMRDKSVKAILFRVDSQGGSPEASEAIRHAIITAQKEGKPVFVSMGSVAASGGYWVAMNADHISASPATLTGSIGVVAGKFVVDGLLKQLGVTMSSISTSPEANLWSMSSEFTPFQRERMNAMMDETYQAFTENVADARKLSKDKIPSFAKGRVWTGEQAKNIGLVDDLGGYAGSFKALRKKLELAENADIILVPFPKPESPARIFLQMLQQLGAENAAMLPLLQNASSFMREFGAALQVMAGNQGGLTLTTPAMQAVR